jgi:glycine cleavage system H lipoate-binding protein
MVLILIITTLAMIGIVATYKTMYQKTRAKNLASGGVVSGVYFHPGHTWVRFTEDGGARIGIDQFLRNVLGEFEEIIVPSSGRRIKQGEPLLTVVKGGKQAHLSSPIDCVIIDNNHSMEDGLRYENDYVLSVKPTRIDYNLPKMKNYVESEDWFCREYARFKDFITTKMFPMGKVGLTMADGGFHVDGVFEKMDEATLKSFNQEFLRC